MTSHLPTSGKTPAPAASTAASTATSTAPSMATSPASATLASHLPGTPTQQGALSVALGAALWGLFWIPLRFLDDHGVTGLWAIALVMSAVMLPTGVALVLTKTLYTLKNTNAWFIGIAMGLSSVLYFTGVIVSDVIRVVFLFYLLPVWTTLGAWVLYKETITRGRLLVIALALVGLWLLLGGGDRIPIPANVGDWCGLFAGFCWGISLVLIRGKDDVNATAMVFTTAVGASVIAVVVALLLLTTGNLELAAIPQIDAPLLVLIATLAFSILLLYPSLLGQIWGAQRIIAPTAALLTMTEILVATASAYFLIGTELNATSIVGAVVILLAVLIDIVLQYRQAEPPASKQTDLKR